MWNSLCVLIIFFSWVCCDDVPIPIASTPLGKISGIYETSYEGRTYSAFYGIPYAKPPVGDLRFQEPQPISSWSGTWKANTSAISCVQVTHVPQPEGGVYIGDEDCLYLNVFVPVKEPKSANEQTLLDVIVHIHAGGLMYGSAATYAGPRFLMDRDVVLVTLNYRVGILGFLSTEDEIVPGNNGMKDQVMALKWIKDNIENFGGNPNSTTITGLSAGGASVHLHYLSPLSKGLFNRGISSSGTALTPWILQEQPLQKARFIGAHLGCTHTKTKKMIKCMRQRPTRQIVEAIRLLRPWLYNPFSPLGVVVEKVGNNKFLPEHPYVLLKKGKFYDVPWMTSVTSEEGLYPAADFVLKPNYFPDLEKRWIELAPFVLDYNYTISSDIKQKIAMKIKKEYLKDQPISSETYKELIDMMTDRLFGIPAEKSVKLQAHKSKSPVYYYYFKYMGVEMESNTVHWTGEDQSDGISHGDDLMYVFSNPRKMESPMKKLTTLDNVMKELMLDIVTTYSAKGQPGVKRIDWLPVSKDLKEPLMQLRIESPSQIVMEPASNIDRHRSMWDSIPFDENENLFPNLVKDEL